MKYTLNLILSKIISRLGFRNNIETLAVDATCLCPSESVEVPAAIYLADDLSLVTDVGIGTTMANELRRISPGLVNHAPTMLYKFSDISLIDGYLLAGCSHIKIDSSKFLRKNDNKTVFREKGALAATFNGCQFFGDWLPDDVLRMLALESIAPLVSPQQKPWFHQRQYLNLINISLEQYRRCVFSEMFVLDDRGQNSYKRTRYSILKNRLTYPLNLCDASNVGVFLLRGKTGSRRAMINEDHVASVCQSIGIQPVDTALLTVEQIIRACAGAKWVVGVEGSQLSHAFSVMAAGAKMLVLQPPHRFNNVYKDRCDCVGSPYGFLVGDAAGEDFYVDTAKLLKLIDKMEANT